MDLWFDYIRGYLSGFLAPGSEPTRAVVVRQEDLLCRPQDVVEALERLGLPRNGTAFSIIENLETGYTGMSRNATFEQEQKVSKLLSLTVPLQAAILKRLVDLGCAPYMAALGYAMPQQTWSAEHSEATRLSVQYGESPPPPPPPGLSLPEKPPAESPKPVPRPTSKPAATWVLLAPLPARSERRRPDAYIPAPCDESGTLAQSAPMATVSSIDAEVQTEALPVLVDASAQAPPVPPEQAMAMQGFTGAVSAMTWYSSAMAWYDTDEGQYALLRSLFQRGTAIPGRPRFDSESGRPVLRLASACNGTLCGGRAVLAVPEGRAWRSAELASRIAMPWAA